MPSTSDSAAIGWLAAATIALHLALLMTQQWLAASGGASAATLYYTLIAALMASYVGVVRKVSASPSRHTWWIVITIPLIVQVGWLLSRPVLAIDAYSYLVDAVHAHAGLNPYQHAVREAGQTDFGRQLSAFGWRPVHGVSPYGPVWMNLVSAVGPFTTDIEVAVRVVKLIAFAATALAAWVIYLAAPAPTRVRRLTLFWWNPVIIIEGAGEGHNDAVMVAAVVFSLWGLHRRAPVTSAGALTAAVLTKWIPVLFAPAFAIYTWRSRLLTLRAVLGGAAIVAGIVAVTYWPLWVGMDTFTGIRTVGGPRFVASTTGVLVRVLPEDSALPYFALRGLVTLITLAVTIWAAWVSRTEKDLARAWAIVVVTYVLLASPLYWAWYVMLPIALLAMADDVALVYVLTAASRLVAPLDVMRVRGQFSWSTEVWVTTIVGVWIPLAYMIWRTTRRSQPVVDAAVSSGHLSRGAA